MAFSVRELRELSTDPRAVSLVAVTMRLLAVLVGVIVATIDGTLRQSWITALALAVLAIGSEWLWRRLQSPWVPVVEMAMAGSILALAMPAGVAFLPYLLVAAGGIGAQCGAWISLTAVAAAAATLILTTAATDDEFVGGTAIPITTWLAVSVISSLAGSWSRNIVNLPTAGEDRYRSAYELLIQLREVTEELPMGLDELTTAEKVLDQVRESVRFERGALLKIDPSGVAQPLALEGTDTLPWYPREDSWLMQRVMELRGPAQSTDRGGEQVVADVETLQRNRAIVPVFLEGNLIAILMLQSLEPFAEEQLTRVQQIVDDSTFMLETSFVFGEIRALATSEERARLAREIHDGIAQEIAGLAFVVDDVAARVEEPEVREDVNRIRSELTRMVSELRLSIFELRTNVDSAEGLGAALSKYAREVGARAGLTMHLVLQEAETRLSPEVEMELMRIVQEALTNILKHAQAKNVWVMLRTAPPKATVRVSDDGIGLGNGRRDSYGLEIMQERAQRIGGSLEVRQRPGGGTVVEVSLDSNPANRKRKRGRTKIETRRGVQT